jgi:hypothetical protein
MTMKIRFLIGLLLAVLFVSLIGTNDALAKRGGLLSRVRGKVEKRCEGEECRDAPKIRSQWWPYDDDYIDPWDEDANVDPIDPLPAPDPEVPDPVPVDPDPVQPDVQPLPEPQPEPAPEDSVVTPPLDHAELNTWIAERLGGYSRANHALEDSTVCIYQARGKQRVVWHVVDNSQPSRRDLADLLFVRAVSGADRAGIVIVDRWHPDHETDWLKSEELIEQSFDTCERLGLWLVVVGHDGEIGRLIYADQTPPTPQPAAQQRRPLRLGR